MRKPLAKSKPVESKKIIAIDFDGTLHNGTTYPFIGEPNTTLIDFIRENQNEYTFILWTMREGVQLGFAKEWIKEQGIKFDYYNDNAPWLKEKYGNNPRKVYADYYVDDHNLSQEYLYTLRKEFI